MKLIDLIMEECKCTEPITRSFIEEVLGDIALFDRKQRDYGSQNIADFGVFGVLVRANDKIARLKNLGTKLATNEAVEDSWRDLSVYGVIARLVRSGKWEKSSDAPSEERSAPTTAVGQTVVVTNSCSGGPAIGAVGRVVKEHSIGRWPYSVSFDDAFKNGHTCGGLTKQEHGYYFDSLDGETDGVAIKRSD